MEPNLNISIKPRNQTGPLITLRDERARAVARSARLGKSLTLAAMSLGYVVVQLDVTIVNVAINSIGADFGGSVADLQWIVNAYTITFAAFILTAGALGDRLGARRVFIAGFAIFLLASLACALAPALPVLIVARLCQGIGAAVLVPNSLALLNHAYPKDGERHWAVGIWAAGASLSLTAGPLVGGALIALSGWRSIFLINLPIGLVGIWLTWRYATETARSAARTIDIPGQTTAVLALGSLAAAMIEGGERGWSDLFVLTGFAGFAVLAALFLAIEFRSQAPMLPLGLFRKPAFSAMSLTGLLVNIGCYGLIFVFSLYFQRLNHLSPLWTGLRADDGGSAGDQFDRGASDCGNRRAADDRYRTCDHRNKLPRTAGSAGGCTLRSTMRATHRLGRRIRFARPADDLDAAGERDQTIFRRRFRRSQCDAPDRQRHRRRALWLAAQRRRRFHRRRPHCARHRGRARAVRDHCGHRLRAAAGVNDNILKGATRSFFTPPRSAAPRAPARVAQARRIPSLP